MKEQIIETSLQEFLKNGIRKMTMQKLVLVLGISTKTMYKYFSDKEALLEECLNVHYKEIDKGVAAAIGSAPDPVTTMWQLYSKIAELDFGTNHLFYHDLNHYYPTLQDKVISRYSGGVTKTFTGFIKQGIKDGYFLAHLNAPVVLEALTVLYASVTRSNGYKKVNLDPVEIIGQTIMIYLRGICTDKGTAIIDQLLKIPN